MPCCEMGMLDWTHADQHATEAGAGGSPTLPLPQTCRRLKLGFNLHQLRCLVVISAS